MYVKSYYDDRKELLEDTSDYPYKPAVSKIDEDNLKKIADDLGVDYINMNDGSALIRLWRIHWEPLSQRIRVRP